jgi:hypothetical protein
MKIKTSYGEIEIINGGDRKDLAKLILTVSCANREAWCYLTKKQAQKLAIQLKAFVITDGYYIEPPQ